MYDCTNRVKTALSEQKQDPLNTSVSVVAPEMQYSRSKSISQPFFTLLPTKGGVVGDVAQRDARAIITFETMYTIIVNVKLAVRSQSSHVYIVHRFKCELSPRSETIKTLILRMLFVC